MYAQTEKLNKKRKSTMTNVFKTLYDEAVESKCDYAGELAGMAFAAQEVLRMIALGRIDGVQGQNRIAVLEDTVRNYYQGKGSSSIFARPYAKLEFKRDAQGNIVVEDGQRQLTEAV
jgi:hypothetical protein